MKKDLLICIAFHFNPDRVQWLSKVLENIYTYYKVSFEIIIDCNKPFFIETEAYSQVQVIFHKDLEHPFYLTWCHRKHVKDNLDKYENFMYIEDDILIPFENYLNYLENFKLMFPKYVPSFVRIERSLGKDYVIDVTEQQKRDVKIIGGKTFAEIKFPFNYHGFWIMPQKELKETLLDTFVRFSQSRETAAAYTSWELCWNECVCKGTLLELENEQISKKCYAYHLPNSYVLSETLNAKIKPQNIFI